MRQRRLRGEQLLRTRHRGQTGQKLIKACVLRDDDSNGRRHGLFDVVREQRVLELLLGGGAANKDVARRLRVDGCRTPFRKLVQPLHVRVFDRLVEEAVEGACGPKDQIQRLR
ncbi:hypothetical protein D9M68_721540 [compost metagenome]